MPWDRATQAAINRALKAAQGRKVVNTPPPISTMSPLQTTAAGRVSKLIRAPGQLDKPSELKSRLTEDRRVRQQFMGNPDEGITNTPRKKALDAVTRYYKQRGWE